jgi:hypothetical protein
MTRVRDIDFGKKLVEEEHLFQFLAAYAGVTGTNLSLQSRSESPDFICADESGKLVGIELTQAPQHYQPLSAGDLLASVVCSVASKERLRRLNGWPMTILVVELLDYSFESLSWTRDQSVADDFSDTGFHEIWLSDHSTVEPFGEVRLIGLYPRSTFGLHYQPALEGKPYG